MAIDTTWFRRRSGKEDSVHARSCCPSKAVRRKDAHDTYEAMDQSAGEGAFSNVQVLKRRRDGAVFALKVFRPCLMVSGKIQAEFYVARMMRHQNIIETYELLEFRGSQSILMEYAPRCLFDLVTTRALKPGDAELYLQQMLSGTAHIHKLGFAHRDLKLENVVLGVDGRAKIIDFGSVRTTRRGRPTNTGSLQYMSPELFKTHMEYDPQLADLWALGIIYTCMILGQFPWAVARSQNPVFAAYTEGDKRNHQDSASSTTDEVTESWPYPLNMMAVPEARSILYGMLRVEPSHRVSLSKTLEALSKYNNPRKDNWCSSTETLV